MHNILTLNNISPKGINLFNSDYNCSKDIQNPEAIIVRSAKMHDMIFNDELIAIARAGAGVNNIPLDKCSEKGVVVFNTPGANANAVKELTIAGLLLSSRRLSQGIEWVKTLNKEENISKLIEGAKSSFKGPELYGKKLGIIGLGAIGSLVANTAVMLGMDVYGYDPYISVKSAWMLCSSVKRSVDIEKIFRYCDYISIHVPSSENTRNMINKQTINRMKDGIRIINFSRGDLVNADDVIKAVKTGKIASYVTDFPTKDMLNEANIIALPHLGASTPESEENCAVMAVNELVSYIEEGNIINSVNMPNVAMQSSGNTRICVLHKNIRNVISEVCGTLSKNDINIENMLSKSKDNYAYAIIDVNEIITDMILNQLNSIDGVIKIRVINR